MLVEDGNLIGNNALQECKLFARGFVENYATSRDRIDGITVKVDRTKTQPIDLVLQVDFGACVHDHHQPGGGGSTQQDFFVERIRNVIGPAGMGFPRAWTATFSPSPRAVWTTDPSLAGALGFG